MALQSFSNDFMDWARARIIEWSEGLVTDENLFDERMQDLGGLIRKGISSKLGYCVALSLATAERVQKSDSADDTVHRIKCQVAVFRGSIAQGVTLGECAWLAETLYLAFSAAQWQPVPGSGRPDVYADAFAPRVEANGAAMFTFAICYEKDIDILNK